MKINVKLLSPEAMLPTYGSDGAAGADLYADTSIKDNLPIIIAPQDTVMIRTGVAMTIPAGYYGHICDRSGLAKNFKLTVLGGIIDDDYRGEVCVLLCNTGTRPQVIKHHERIAQIVFKKYERVEFDLVDSLDETVRGEGGFGSTGK